MNTFVSPEGIAGSGPAVEFSKRQDLGRFPTGKSARYYFDLILHLVQRDFILRYKGSALGVLWVLLIPLTHLLLLVFTFDKVVPLNIDSYPAFVFTALLPWTWFSGSISSAAGLFISNRDLVRRPNFPPVILVVVNTLSNLLLYLSVLPIVLIILFYHGRSLSWALPWLPLLVIIQSILITGLSLMISTWNVFYRDVQQILGVLLMLSFYITPVFYQPELAAEKYRFLFSVNPVAVLVQAFRDVLFYSRAPEWHLVAYSGIVSVGVAALGFFIYNRQLPKVIDAL